MYYHDKKRVLFIGVSCSGSTAIGEELKQNYGFKQIAHKHCNFRYFKKFLYKYYKKPSYVMVVKRDPEDKAKSAYTKLMNNHKSAFSRNELFDENGGNISKKMRILRDMMIKEDFSFNRYLQKRYSLFGYYDDLLYNLKYSTHVLDFNNLGSDFETCMKDMGFSINSRLQARNRTQKNINTEMDVETQNKIFSCYKQFVNKNSNRLNLKFFIYKIFIFFAERRRTTIEKRLYINWLARQNKYSNS